MAICQYCGKDVLYPFKCKYCNGTFCEDHRLPPNHNCINLHLWKRKRAPEITLGTKKRKYTSHSKPITTKRYRKKRSIPKWTLFLLLVSIFLYLVYGGYFNSFIGKNYEIKKAISLETNERVESVGNIIKELTKTPKPINEETYEIENLTLKKVNSIRKSNGLHELKWDPLLAELARNHSLDMVKNDFFSHVNLKGEDPTERARKLGIKTSRRIGNTILMGIGENIGKIPKGEVVGFGYVSSPEDVANAAMQIWMASPGHRANILNKNYIYIGIGVAFDNEEDTFYLTQDFK